MPRRPPRRTSTPMSSSHVRRRADQQAAQRVDLVAQRVDRRQPAQPLRHDVDRVERVGREEQRHGDGLADAHQPVPVAHQPGQRHRQAGEERRAEHHDAHRREDAQRVDGQVHAHQVGDRQHADHLRHRPHAGRERLAGDQRRRRCGRDHQLGQDAGVAVPDDLDAVEDRDEQRRLRDDARCQERQVGHRPGVDDVQLGERLAEDQQPQRRLHHAGEQLGAVVAQLLQFDERESAHPRDQSAVTRRHAARCADQARRRTCRVN